MTTTWTDYRGHKWPVTTEQGKWLTAYQDEALRRGYLKQGLDIEQTIGGAPASAGTHLLVNGKACCIDTADWSAEMVNLARAMGADATWHRKKNWDNRGGSEHCHINLRGIVNRYANYQYDSPSFGVDHGHNGLANGAKDDGPRPLSRRTWEEGIAWAKAQAKPKITATVRVGTLNMPDGAKLPNPVERSAAAAALMKAAKPDVFGTQEGVGPVNGKASPFTAGFDADMGAGWWHVTPTLPLNENYVFYQHATIEVVHQYGDSVIRAKVGKRAVSGRHVTRVVLRHKPSGLVFALGVTQLVNNDREGAQAQSVLVASTMKAVAAKHDNCPVILVGDMNTSDDLKGCVDAGMLNVRKVAKSATNRDAVSYTNISKTKPSTNLNWLIDQVWISKSQGANGYTVLQDLDADGKFNQPRPSDHAPIITSLKLTH